MTSCAFNLANPQHISMRRLMAEIYQKFFHALQQKNFYTAQKYQGMASALVSVSLLVLRDVELYEMSALLSDVLHVQLQYQQWRTAA
ncbi:hypothetical protein D5018_20135 [Parashewanella curva]|uniref:Uncharacterized protein n=1 Tax=Parashewanella curva TaxID=2338552 RepID=A0A3L8PRA9_9GAMM|nr:hypothetical protein [Parashewanella curva]RLV57895.1 hypothetical protein D5018_20135 [Parashewanella curva]